MDDVFNNEDAIETSRSIRDVRPAHYLLKIESFSVLSESGIQKYESDEFEAGGYKWRLCLYPNGKKKTTVNNHVSLYLVISNTNSLPQDWEVNVQFKLFVYDHIRDKYLTIQDADGRIRRFHGMKKEQGFSQLISLDTFSKASNGYLFEDMCVFGAEVFVIKYRGKGQCLSMVKESRNTNTFTWKIDNFGTIKDVSLSSEAFKVGELNWKLLLYPKSIVKGKGSISLFLSVAETATLSLNWRNYAKYKLRVRDQLRSFHVEHEVDGWFCDSITDWGYSSFMLLTDLNDKSKGFIVNDTLIVEAEITITAMTKNFG